MSSQSQFDRHPEAIERPLGRVGKKGLTTLLAGGIINPFGPTLFAVALDGEVEPGRHLAILHLMLNPFSQVVREVGTATIREEWSPLVDIPTFFDLSPASCPTLLLPSALLTHDQAVDLYARFLGGFDDGYSLLTEVRRFPGDPWSRVQQEVDGIGDRLNGGRRSKAGSRVLTEGEAAELSRVLLEPANQKVELQAFMVAWDGSIKFQGAGTMSQTAMSLEAFIDVFSTLAMTCEIPQA